AGGGHRSGAATGAPRPPRAAPGRSWLAGLLVRDIDQLGRGIEAEFADDVEIFAGRLHRPQLLVVSLVQVGVARTEVAARAARRIVGYRVEDGHVQIALLDQVPERR